MKKIINKGLDFYEKEFRDGCSFLEDLAGSPSSGVKLDSYINYVHLFPGTYKRISIRIFVKNIHVIRYNLYHILSI